MWLNPVWRTDLFIVGDVYLNVAESSYLWQHREGEIRFDKDSLLGVGDDSFNEVWDILPNWDNIIAYYCSKTQRTLQWFNNNALENDMRDVLEDFGVRYAWDYLTHIDLNDMSDTQKIRDSLDLSLQMLVNRVEICYKDKFPILRYYKAQEEALLNKVENTSEYKSRFNDTPQNGGDWGDDNHTTNITSSTTTSGTDFDTPMARLEEIRTKWRSIKNEMVDYIGEIVIMKGNL